MAEGYRFTHPRIARLRNCLLADCASLSRLDGRMDSCVAGKGMNPARVRYSIASSAR
jgi:hypothetical protein